MNRDKEKEESVREKNYLRLKRNFHCPLLSNRDAREMMDAYRKCGDDPERMRKLEIKYFWHRIVNGWKYRAASSEKIGMDIVRHRLSERGCVSKRDILLVSHEMSLTGAPRAVFTLAIELRRQGWNPYILSLEGGDLIAEASEAGIPVVCSPTDLFRGGLPNGGDEEISRFVKSFSTVLINTIDSLFYFTVPMGENTRKLLWIHEARSSYVGERGEKFDKQLERVDQVLVVGDHARKNASDFTKRSKEFINFYYGVEELPSLESSEPEFMDGRLHLLMAGLINERKGHHILLEALEKLPVDVKDRLIFHIAGPTQDDDLNDQFAALKDPSVKIEGCLSHDKLMELMNRCDGLLCPSLDDPMPIVCTEAFQLSKPVIVSDHTGTASFIEDGANGFLVKSGDTDSLVKGLCRFVEKRDELAQVGKRGNSIYREHFSREAFSRSVKELFPLSGESDRPKVSVIVPNYNYERYLGERIESILNQTYKDFELILLDDASTDGSMGVLERYSHDSRIPADRVKVVAGKENSGSPFIQWEKGLGLARGEYVWIAEADDLAEPTLLEKSVAAMESNPEVVLVKNMSELIDKNGNRSDKPYFESFQPDGKVRVYDGENFLAERMINDNGCYNASMMVFRKSVWETMTDKSYMKMRYAGDWLFWGLMMKEGKIAEVCERLNKFRFHGNSVTDSSASRITTLRGERLIIKHKLWKSLKNVNYGVWLNTYYHYWRMLGSKNQETREILSAAEKCCEGFSEELRSEVPSGVTLWLYKHLVWRRPDLKHPEKFPYGFMKGLD